MADVPHIPDAPEPHVAAAPAPEASAAAASHPAGAEHVASETIGAAGVHAAEAAAPEAGPAVGETAAPAAASKSFVDRMKEKGSWAKGRASETLLQNENKLEKAGRWAGVAGGTGIVVKGLSDLRRDEEGNRHTFKAGAEVALGATVVGLSALLTKGKGAEAMAR